MNARLLLAPLLLAALLAAGASAQIEEGFASVDETRTAMERALQDQRAAQARAQALERAASRADAAVDRTASEAAALAARIQESEAGIAAAEARLALIDRQRRQLAAQLAKRQKPVVRLTAALQRFSRRPLALSVMRPGSVKEMVYLRAMLSTTVPEVQRRTAALRSEIERGKALQREARQALAALRGGEKQLEDRRKELAALETRQRLASREASGEADREAERALALAEQARDLDALVDTLNQAGSLRDRLAALPGPIIRPPRPDQSSVLADAQPASLAGRGAPAGYQLPVSGRTVTGFGAPTTSGGLSQGLRSPRAKARRWLPLARAGSPSPGPIAAMAGS